MTNIFNGTGTALVTPFNKGGEIDFESLNKLIDQQIAGGVDFLVVQGTTGESPTLSQDEKMKVLDVIIQRNNGRLPIVYGCGGNNTRAVSDLLEKIPEGVDGILSVSPYYNKPTQNGIVAHFTELSKHTDLPIILYNVPGRTASNMSVDTTLKLAEIKNIVAVKEASGDMGQIMNIINHRPEGFGVLSGDDPLTMPLMAAGADGVISVVSNAFPKQFSTMVRSAAAGQLDAARSLHYSLLSITADFFAEGNPAGVKESLACQGIMEAHLRMPLMPVSEGLKSKIIAATKEILNT